MLRKFGLGLVAASALVIGMAGMTSDASARGGHGGWHGGGGGWHGGGWHGGGWHGGGWHGGGWRGGPGWHGGWRRGWGPGFVVAPGFYGGGCWVRRWVATPWGWRVRTVNRCGWGGGWGW